MGGRVLGGAELGGWEKLDVLMHVGQVVAICLEGLRQKMTVSQEATSSPTREPWLQPLGGKRPESESTPRPEILLPGKSTALHLH